MACSDPAHAFMDFTGVTDQLLATTYLRRCDMSLDAAVALYFDELENQEQKPPVLEKRKPQKVDKGTVSTNSLQTLGMEAVWAAEHYAMSKKETDISADPVDSAVIKAMHKSSRSKKAADVRGDLFTLLIHFHHILNESKREAIQNWAHELALGGVSRPGTPGLVIVEGCKESVYLYVRRLRALRWQSMELRCMEQVCVDAPTKSQSMDQLRRFKLPFHECPPNGDHAYLAYCDDAGMAAFARAGLDDTRRIKYRKALHLKSKKKKRNKKVKTKHSSSHPRVSVVAGIPRCLLDGMTYSERRAKNSRSMTPQQMAMKSFGAGP